MGEAGRKQSHPLPPRAGRRPTGAVASVGLPEQPCSQGRLCLEVKQGDLEGQPFVQKQGSHAMQESPVIFQVRKILWRMNRLPTPVFLGFPGGSAGKESPCNVGDSEFSPWVGKIPWRRTWQPTSVFLPGESPWIEDPARLQSMGSQRLGHE